MLEKLQLFQPEGAEACEVGLKIAKIICRPAAI